MEQIRICNKKHDCESSNRQITSDLRAQSHSRIAEEFIDTQSEKAVRRASPSALIVIPNVSVRDFAILAEVYNQGGPITD